MSVEVNSSLGPRGLSALGIPRVPTSIYVTVSAAMGIDGPNDGKAAAHDGVSLRSHFGSELKALPFTAKLHGYDKKSSLTRKSSRDVRPSKG